MLGRVPGLIDQAAEALIAPSFTRAGYDLRSRLEDWTSLDSYDLTGRRILITGGTSGLGRAAVEQFVRCGADVTFTGRRSERNEEVRAEIQAATGGAVAQPIAADMGDLDQVRALADQIGDVDVLIHNAGALTPDRRVSPDGTEATVASQVVGPFLLTSLLLDQLAAGEPGRVLTMSSGGMYSARLSVSGLEMSEADYNGTTQYALAKRAQVTLNEMWAERFEGAGVVFHALHPGWADTPGVEESLPVFRKVVGPLLRSSEQGSDTLVWLGADDGQPTETSGLFWHDRQPRSIHRLASTRRSDTPERRSNLWDWCCERSGAN